jgi:hypothetical protein
MSLWDVIDGLPSHDKTRKEFAYLWNSPGIRPGSRPQIAPSTGWRGWESMPGLMNIWQMGASGRSDKADRDVKRRGNCTAGGGRGGGTNSLAAPGSSRGGDGKCLCTVRRIKCLRGLRRTLGNFRRSRSNANYEQRAFRRPLPEVLAS